MSEASLRRNAVVFQLVFLSIPLFLLVLSLINCASQIPPSGGPPDTEPPTIIRTVPDTNAVHVTENRIELEFSEYVDRRSVEESIFISPPAGRLEFDWGGTDVTVSFEDTLRSKTTYVITIGTDVVDKRAGNRMASGFTLAFSTGDSLDHGSISGRVFDKKPEGIMIFAYSLRGINPDTLNPARRKPDYLMQTGKDGKFTISNMAWGLYRIFAVKDEYRNLLYDRQVDYYGVASREIALSKDAERVGQVWFRMAREDTARPFLTNVEAINRNFLKIRFSEPIDSSSFEHAKFALSDTLSGTAIGISLSYQESPGGERAAIFTSVPVDSGVIYRISLQAISDTAGNMIDPEDKGILFVGTGVPDTVRPGLRMITPIDTTIGYDPHHPLELSFSEPVNRTSLANAILLQTKKKETMGSTLRWVNPVRLELQPEDTAMAGGMIEMKVVMDSLRDLAGNRYKDSVMTVSVPVLDPKKMGEVEGIVTDPVLPEKGNIMVTAQEVGKIWTRTIRLQGTGKFVIGRLPEGRYVLSAFRDTDNSGKYSPGLPFPFELSERFVVDSDTIKVRARWGVEGIALTLP